MRPRAKSLIGLSYWPMRAVNRVLYGPHKDYALRRTDGREVRVGFPPCWEPEYLRDGTVRHCRKPRGHAGVCAYW